MPWTLFHTPVPVPLHTPNLIWPTLDCLLVPGSGQWVCCVHSSVHKSSVHRHSGAWRFVSKCWYQTWTCSIGINTPLLGMSFSFSFVLTVLLSAIRVLGQLSAFHCKCFPKDMHVIACKIARTLAFAIGWQMPSTLQFHNVLHNTFITRLWIFLYQGHLTTTMICISGPANRKGARGRAAA